MPTLTYIPLQTITLGSAASSVTFASIPQTYRDLVVSIGGTSSGGSSPSLRFNGDSGTNYTIIRMYATPATSASQSFTAAYGSIGFMNTEQSTVLASIFDYSASDKHTTVLSRGGNTDTIRAEGFRWANTSPITSVNVGFDGAQTYSVGTVISLYGIEA